MDGVTLAQLDGNSSVGGPSSLEVYVPLPESSYSIAYAVTGLSNSGDWYVVGVAENWPSCSGYQEVVGVYNDTGSSVSWNCYSTLSFSAGDLVDLILTFEADHTISLQVVRDSNGTSSYTVSVSQPDSGGTHFVPLSTVSDSNGYLTGAMTQVIDQAATSCTSYLGMPRVDYEWTSAFYVSEYIPYADTTASDGTVCYTGGGNTVTLLPGDRLTYYVDAAQGSGYGPHYVAGQNYSLVDAHDSTYNIDFGFRCQTDPVPLTAVNVTASPSVVQLGGTSKIVAAASGGAPPDTALWIVNGSYEGPGDATRTFNATAWGSYRFAAYALDSDLDVFGPSLTITVQVVNIPLAVAPPYSSAPNGTVDLGQAVSFRATATGGLPPYRFAWIGVPAGCPASTVAELSCRPTIVGTFQVKVDVSDAYGSSVSSPPTVLIVYAPLAMALTISKSVVDVNETLVLRGWTAGGSGALWVSWSGLPDGCFTTASVVLTCRPSTPGNYSPVISAADSDGGTASSSPVAIEVLPAPAVRLAADRSVVDVGGHVAFTASARDGAAGYNFIWSGLPPGCAPQNVARLSCTLSDAGESMVGVSVIDAIGGRASSDTVDLRTFANLTVALTAPATVVLGRSAVLNVTVMGGAPPIEVRWFGIPAGCAPPTSGNLVCAPPLVGSYNISVRATDASGVSTSAVHELTVVAPLATNDTTEASGPLPVVVAGISVAGLAAVAAFLLLRRHRTTTPVDPGDTEVPEPE